jgi:hypothetical protein
MTGTRRSRSLIREALENLLARPGLTLALISTFTGLTLWAVTGEVSASVQIRNYGYDLQRHGYFTLLLHPQEETSDVRLTTADCASAGASPGVIAALAVSPVDEPYRLWATTGPEVPTQVVSGDVGAFLTATSHRPISAWEQANAVLDQASPLHVPPSTGPFPLSISGTRDTSTVLAVTADLSALGSGMQGNLMIVDNRPGPVKGCAFLVDERHRFPVVKAISTAFPPDLGYAAVWALPNADQFDTPTRRFESRTSQWFWMLAWAMGTLVWAGFLRIRRPEFALYAVCGLGWRRVSTIAVGELLMIVVMAFASAAAAVVGLTLAHGTRWPDLVVGVLAGTRFGVAALLGCTAVAVHAGINATRGTLDALKDR